MAEDSAALAAVGSAVVDAVAASVRLPPAVVATALGRQGYGVSRITPAVLAEQHRKMAEPGTAKR